MLDEELPPPGRSARRSRLLRAAAVLVVLVIVGAAITRLATHSTPHAAPATVTVAPPSGHAPSGQAPSGQAPSGQAPSGQAPTSLHGSPVPPTRTRPPAAAEPPAALDVLRHLSSAAIDAAHAECPRAAAYCATTGETPAAVGAAIRAAFPQAGHLVAVTDLAYRSDSGPHLAFRRLSARAGRVTIAVEIRGREPGDGVAAHAVLDGSHRVVRRETVIGALTVEVQAAAPADHRVDASRVARLLHDPRLFATG